MKLMRIISCLTILFFFLFQGSARGQDWAWSWSDLTVPGSGNTELQTDAWYPLHLENDTNLRFLRPLPDNNSLYMIHYTEQNPVPHNWTETLLPNDGFPGDVLFASYSPRGDNIRAAFSMDQDTDEAVLCSYLLNPDSPGEGWVEESSLSVPFEATYDDDVYYEDLNADGIEDWILLQASPEEPFIHTYLSDPSEESGWQIISHQLLPTYSDTMYYFYGMNLVRLNENDFSLMVSYSKMTWDGMQIITGIKRLLYVREFDTENPSFGPIALSGGYSVPFSCVDLDRDGHDEVVVKRMRVWESYSMSNDGTSLQFLANLTPPSNVVGMERNSQDLETEYFNLTRTWIDQGTDGYWASSIYDWRYDPDIQGWQNQECMLAYAPCNRFRLGSALYEEVPRKYIVSLGMYTDHDSYPVTTLFWEAGTNDEDWVEDARYNTIGNPSFPQVEYTNLDRDETLEGIYCRENEIVEYDLVDDTWTESRTWSTSEVDIGGWILVDLDGDQLDDLYLLEARTALLQRRNDLGISWEESNPFEEFDPIPEDEAPVCISDVDGNGSNDFVYSDGSVLLNFTGVLEVSPETASLPERFALMNAYPNPFNPTTTITLEVPNSGRLAVDVCDILGRQVAVLMDKVTTAGVKRLTFDGTGHASGAYIIRASLNGAQVRTRQVVLVK